MHEPKREAVVTTVYLIRHGESEANVLPHFQGTYDTALTEKGVRQTQLLAERFREIPLDVICYSPWQRTKATADALNQYHHLEMIPVYDLHELDGGDWEGIPLAELAEKYPAEIQVWNERIWDFQAPNGEAMSALYQRMADVMLRIVQAHAGKTIAVCSHGCAILNFLCFAEFGDRTRLNDVGWADNTAVSQVEYDSETGWKLIRKNSVSHLPAELLNPNRREEQA